MLVARWREDGSRLDTSFGTKRMHGTAGMWEPRARNDGYNPLVKVCAPHWFRSVKHVKQRSMTRMSVRDIRLKWPEAERKLATVGEIVVTRDSKPVARILPYEPRQRRSRKRFDPVEHARWLRDFWKRQPRQASTDELLKRERAE